MAFDEYKYSNDYSREHYRQYNFRVSREYDQDIIEGIDTMRNAGVPINAFIRECIREALNKEGFLEGVIDKNESLKRSRF